MKLAFAGKGGTGKTTITSWLADYLARRGKNVWLVDADTALSLASASGLPSGETPIPLSERRDIIESRIRGRGDTMLNLTPEVGDLPEALSVRLPLGCAPLQGTVPGEKRLLVMGGISGAGGGCACEANALLKALLAHLVLERDEWVLVDLEAGVEHLGRGTAMYADGIVIVSEPSLRALETASQISGMASSIGVNRQILALNRASAQNENQLAALPDEIASSLPERHILMPKLAALEERQFLSGSVIGLEDNAQLVIDSFCQKIIGHFSQNQQQL